MPNANDRAKPRIRPLCAVCAEPYSPLRRDAGFRVCMSCGERKAREVRHTVAPMNKSNYYYVADPAFLTQLNPKRTT